MEIFERYLGMDEFAMVVEIIMAVILEIFVRVE
jgi:hypothetical protein